MKKEILGIAIDTEPHKIARELVNYMLNMKIFLTIDQLTQELSRTNTTKNLKTRIKRCLTNKPNAFEISQTP